MLKFIFIIVALFLCVFCNQVLAQQANESKPNIIFIFADDQGYQDIGCFGAEGFETPNLDRLAQEGTRFTSFYVAATVCTPSRAAFLTGSYPKRVGLHEAVLFPFSKTGLASSEITIAEMLKTVGYKTGMIGKWHLGHQPEFMPNTQGFDYYFGVPYSNDMHAHNYKSHNFQAPPLPVYRNTEQVDSGPDQSQLTKRYTEEAVGFINKNKDKPFFLYLPHTMPHLPLFASEKFKGKTKRGLYGDVIEELDWSVGEVMKALKTNGIEKNTLVIYTSDNGPVGWGKTPGSAKPLRGTKATTWEGGQRVPCIMRWPEKIPVGKTCDLLLTTMDLLPTFARMSGSKIPSDRKLDGFDILDVLQNPETGKSPREEFFYYDRDGNLAAMRMGKWKLHILKKRGWNRKQSGEFKPMLFDLKADIGEQKNLIKSNKAIAEKMKQRMAEFDATLTKEARPVGVLKE